VGVGSAWVKQHGLQIVCCVNIVILLSVDPCN